VKEENLIAPVSVLKTNRAPTGKPRVRFTSWMVGPDTTGKKRGPAFRQQDRKHLNKLEDIISSNSLEREEETIKAGASSSAPTRSDICIGDKLRTNIRQEKELKRNPPLSLFFHGPIVEGRKKRTDTLELDRAFHPKEDRRDA